MLHYDRAIIISDLHLLESRPGITRAFFQLLEQLPGQTQALFILGDFFEYWVGDDAATPFHLDVAERLRALSQSVNVHLMVGNRDFAMGEEYTALCGATLLPDPTLVELGGMRWLLSHGDELCTDDKGYQRYRKVIRHPWILGTLRRMPLPWRIKLADYLRGNSQQRNRMNIVRYVDVTESAVQQWLADSQVDGLVHGHTHKADWHQHRLKNGITKPRLVLGDWHHHGWYLSFDVNRQQLHRFNIEDGPELSIKDATTQTTA